MYCNPDGPNNFNDQNSEIRPFFYLTSSLNLDNINPVNFKVIKIDFNELKWKFMKFHLNEFIKRDPDTVQNADTFQY